MGLLFLFCLLAGLVIFIRVVVDIFKKSIWLGAASIVLYPIPFIYVFTHYSGKRLYTGLALWASFVIPLSIQSIDVRSAERELSLFKEAIEQQVGKCIFSSTVAYSYYNNTVGLICSTANLEVMHLDAKAAASYLQKVVVEPALDKYNNEAELELVLEFATKSRVSVCFEITVNGELEDLWYSDEVCH